MLLITRDSVLGHPYIGTQADKTASVCAFLIAVTREERTLGTLAWRGNTQPGREVQPPLTTPWPEQVMGPHPNPGDLEVESSHYLESRVLEIFSRQH